MADLALLFEVKVTNEKTRDAMSEADEITGARSARSANGKDLLNDLEDKRRK